MRRTLSVKPQDNQVDRKGPIMVSIGDMYNLDELTMSQIENIQERGINLHYRGKIVQKYLKFKQGSVTGAIVKREGTHTNLISNISEETKFSEDYYNCTGIVVVGTDKHSGKNISFMTHQNPSFFLKKRLGFKKDLIGKLREMIDRCSVGSISVGIFGGKERTGFNMKEYKDSVRLLSNIVKGELEHSPTVLIGPVVQTAEPTHAYFDTRNRHLHILRDEPLFQETNESYPSEKVAEYITSIKKRIRNCLC